GNYILVYWDYFCRAWHLYRGVVVMTTIEQLKQSNILVLGLAKSGTAAAEWLLNKGITVRINDGAQNTPQEQIESFKKMGADVITGAHPLSVLNDIDMIIKNPGIPYEHALIVEALKRDIPI